MAKVISFEDVKPGMTVYVEEHPTGNWAVDGIMHPEEYEILNVTADNQLEFIWHIGFGCNAWHGFLGRDDHGYRIWDSRPLYSERLSTPWAN